MRVALVGSGRGGARRAEILSRMGVLRAVCGADPRGEGPAGGSPVDRHGSVDGLLAAGGFDAAVVCAPPPARAEVAARLLEAKKHVLVEIPVGCGPARGRELEDLASRNGVVLAAGCTQRFNPAAGAARDLVGSGGCGGLLALEIRRGGRAPPGAGEGVVCGTSVLDIDAAAWMFGGAPSVVFARAGRVRHDREDLASVMLGFGGGRAATISSDWAAPAEASGFRAVCADAVIEADCASQEVRVEAGGGPEARDVRRGDPLLLETRNFVDAAGGRARPGAGPREAAGAERVAEAALLSSGSGAPIYLETK